jgi:site-specific DNA-cytosine methylase
MKKIKVLSLFDGISCARLSLHQLGIECEYYASEIDVSAMKIAKKNFPDIVHIGNVENVKGSDFFGVDLLIGGSPCQSLSSFNHFHKNDTNKGLNGKSKLFFEYVRVLNEAKPEYFLFENVASMSESDCDTITSMLGVQPVRINSKLLTAQLRDRLYWTNIPGICQPEDKGIKFQDILIDGYTEREKSLCFIADYRPCVMDYLKGKRQIVFTHPVERRGKTFYIDGKEIIYSKEKKDKFINELKPYIRKLYPVEAERFQGLPDNYTEGVSITDRYRMIGNAFTVPVITHILKNIKF